MKQFLKKWLPNPHILSEQPSMGWLKRFLHYGYLWHLQRRTVAGGVAVGLFINFMPVPLQLVWAALLACWFRVNLPIAVIMTWINNPFTFIPINFMIYQVGAWILGENNTVTSIQLPHWEWHWESAIDIGRAFFVSFASLGKAYLIGLPIISFGAALLGYGLVQLVWRTMIFWRRRRNS